MGHMIERQKTGEYSMAWAGEVPWHGLGKNVPADLTPEQMMEAAGLNWEVQKIPAFATFGKKKIPVGKSALVRVTDGRVLDVVGDDWNPCQNAEAFKFFNDFVGAGDMAMETAGSLSDGRRIWALARVKESFELFKGDKVDAYLLFSNPHLYGKTIDIQFTPIRVVCHNTLSLSLSLGSRNRVSVSHRVKFDGDTVKEMLGIAKDKLETYKETAAYLGSKRASEESLQEYFNRLWPKLGEKKPVKKAAKAAKQNSNVVDIDEDASRNAKIAMDILEQQPGAEFAKGSWWQGFNAATFMVDHVIGRNNDNRMNSAWFGWGKNLKTKALETAMEMAEGSPDLRKAKAKVAA